MGRSKREIIADLARKHNVSQDIIEKAVMSQFKFVRRVMSRGRAEGVRLPYFGKFHVDPRRLENLNKKTDGKLNKVHNELYPKAKNTKNTRGNR